MNKRSTNILPHKYLINLTNIQNYFYKTVYSFNLKIYVLKIKDPKIDMAEYERIMSQIFDNTISEMNTKYNEDMQEASKHIQNLRDLNEKLEHE